MRRRASRPGRGRRREETAFDPSEVVGLLIDAAGTPNEGDIYNTVSDVAWHNPELGRAMLRVVQTMRDAGVLKEHEAWHLFYWITEGMSFHWSATDPELERLTGEIDAIERSHALSEDESFFVDDAPADWTALSKEWERRLDAIWADEFARLGEAELARLIRSGLLHEDPRLAEGRASLRARSRE